MTAPFNPHAARSRWFTAPLADVTPREAALRRDLLAAVEWAEGLGPFEDQAFDAGYSAGFTAAQASRCR